MDIADSLVARTDQIERWLAIPGYEGIYEVSDLGRVRSLNRIVSSGHRRQGVILKPAWHQRGYPMVNLWRNNSQRMQLVHRLVLMTFVGPAPHGTEALHGDGDAANAALANLSWGTHSENQADQVAHGTHGNASKGSCPSGHEYTEANTYIYPGKPHRGCRECRREYARAWKAANPERSRELSRRAQLKYQAKKKAA